MGAINTIITFLLSFFGIWIVAYFIGWARLALDTAL